MNFDPSFHTSKEFRAFKRSVGSDALDYLFSICTICQVRRTLIQEFKNDQDVADTLGVSYDQGKIVFDALKNGGLIESFNSNGETDHYKITIFERMNKSLIACWVNGKSRRRRGPEEATKKDTETGCDSDEDNPF